MSLNTEDKGICLNSKSIASVRKGKICKVSWEDEQGVTKRALDIGKLNTEASTERMKQKSFNLYQRDQVNLQSAPETFQEKVRTIWILNRQVIVVSHMLTIVTQYYQLHKNIEYRLNKVQEEWTKLNFELECIEALQKKLFLLSQSIQPEQFLTEPSESNQNAM